MPTNHFNSVTEVRLESMLDTAVAAYEAHREALERVYGVLFEQYNRSGRIVLAHEEAEALLRAISQVLEKNALQFKPFEECSGYRRSIPQSQLAAEGNTISSVSASRMPQQSSHQAKQPYRDGPAAREHSTVGNENGDELVSNRPTPGTYTTTPDRDTSQQLRNDSLKRGTAVETRVQSAQSSQVPRLDAAKSGYKERPSTPTEELVPQKPHMSRHRPTPSTVHARPQQQESSRVLHTSPPRRTNCSDHTVDRVAYPNHRQQSNSRPSLSARTDPQAESRSSPTASTKRYQEPRNAVTRDGRDEVPLTAEDNPIDCQVSTRPSDEKKPRIHHDGTTLRNPEHSSVDAREHQPLGKQFAGRTKEVQPHLYNNAASQPEKTPGNNNISAPSNKLRDNSRRAPSPAQQVGVPLTPWPIHKHTPEDDGASYPSLADQYKQRRSPETKQLEPQYHPADHENVDDLYDQHNSHRKSRHQSRNRVTSPSQQLRQETNPRNQYPINYNTHHDDRGSSIQPSRRSPSKRNVTSSYTGSRCTTNTSNRNAMYRGPQEDEDRPSGNGPRLRHHSPAAPRSSLETAKDADYSKPATQNGWSGEPSGRSRHEAVATSYSHAKSPRTHPMDENRKERYPSGTTKLLINNDYPPSERNSRNAPQSQYYISDTAMHVDACGNDVHHSVSPTHPGRSPGVPHPLRTAPSNRVSPRSNNSHQVERLVYGRLMGPTTHQRQVLEDLPDVEAYLREEDAQLEARRQQEIASFSEVDGTKRSGASNGTQKHLRSAAEEQLSAEQTILINQLETLQSKLFFSAAANHEMGNERRYAQFNARIQRVRKDLDMVDRELETVCSIERRESQESVGRPPASSSAAAAN